MSSAPFAFARLVACSVLLLGLSSGCGAGSGSDPLPPPVQRPGPDADASTAPPASRLAFSTSPRTGTAGAELGLFEVLIQNEDGETMAGATETVTVTLGSSPAEASLKGTVAVAAVEGVARFTTLVLEKAAQGYTLVASASGLSGATSPAFEVIPAAPASLVVAQVPATVTAGVAMSPEVTALDAFGNVAVGYSGTVRFSSDDDSASLPADSTFTSADAGHRLFPEELVLRRAGTRWISVRDLAEEALRSTSEVEVLAGPSNALVFVTQPGNGSVRAPFGAQVALVDLFGNPSAASGAAVTLGLSPSGTLAGPLSATAAGGTASFSGLSIAEENVDYVLTASAEGLIPASSEAFTITDDVAPASPVLEELASAATSIAVGWKAVGDDGALGAASHYELRYATSPVESEADYGMAALAAGGWNATPAGTALSATISGLTPDTTYFVALKALDTAGNSARVTRPVSTRSPTASKLAFLDQPSTRPAGSAQAPIRVAIQDAGGLLVSQATSAVTLTVEGVSGFGPFYAVADHGVATFSDVRIDTAGTGYTLAATSGALSPDTSNAFDIVPGAASKLAFRTQPAHGTVRVPLAPVEVAVLDAFGNTVGADTTEITVWLAGGSPAATLGGALATTASAGIALFPALTVDQQGVDFRLEASGGSLGGASSGTFVIEDDLAPQAAPLVLASKTSVQVELSWTAVADDGLLGPAAARYDLRYSTSPVTEESFAAATPVATGSPGSPGAAESAVVSGLTPDTTYFFALRVEDDAGNASELSTLETTTDVGP